MDDLPRLHLYLSLSFAMHRHAAEFIVFHEYMFDVCVFACVCLSRGDTSASCQVKPEQYVLFCRRVKPERDVLFDVLFCCFVLMFNKIGGKFKHFQRAQIVCRHLRSSYRDWYRVPRGGCL